MQPRVKSMDLHSNRTVDDPSTLSNGVSRVTTQRWFKGNKFSGCNQATPTNFTHNNANIYDVQQLHVDKVIFYFISPVYTEMVESQRCSIFCNCRSKPFKSTLPCGKYWILLNDQRNGARLSYVGHCTFFDWLSHALVGETKKKTKIKNKK